MRMWSVSGVEKLNIQYSVFRKERPLVTEMWKAGTRCDLSSLPVSWQPPRKEDE